MVASNEDIQYLKNLRPDWPKSLSTCIMVAEIIDKFGGFADKSQVIDFFENPGKWEHEIDYLKELEG